MPYNAYMAIKNVDGAVSTWVPSVNDCLATDWGIIGDTVPESGIPPHQQRVLDEKRELDERLSAGRLHSGQPLYRQLPTSEQDRMARQSRPWLPYSGVLAERIEAFDTPAATPPQAATITLPVVDPGPDFPWARDSGQGQQCAARDAGGR